MSEDQLFDPDTRPPHQRTLSDPATNKPGKARADASDTMRSAAGLALPRTGTWRRKVLQAFVHYESGGLTDDEVQEFLNMNPSTERPRRIELVEMGWLADSGLRRRTQGGREAVVWVLSPAGRGEMP